MEDFLVGPRGRWGCSSDGCYHHSPRNPEVDAAPTVASSDERLNTLIDPDLTCREVVVVDGLVGNRTGEPVVGNLLLGTLLMRNWLL